MVKRMHIPQEQFFDFVRGMHYEENHEWFSYMEAISLALARGLLLTASNVWEVRWKNERVARDERKHDSRF